MQAKKATVRPGHGTTEWFQIGKGVHQGMFKLVLEKAEEPEIKLPTSAGSWKNQESSRKTSISVLLSVPKVLTVWITINCGKFFKRWVQELVRTGKHGMLQSMGSQRVEKD